MRVFRLIEIQVLDGGELPHGNLLSNEAALGVFSSPENAEAMIRANAEKIEAERDEWEGSPAPKTTRRRKAAKA